MKRATPVILAILLGAIATAAGMGVFLKLANDDRARLGAEIETARAEASEALRDKERIAQEANQKVQSANDEVANAQRILQQLEEEQRLLVDAKQLSKPSARELRGWQSTFSLPLGLSLFLPPRTSVETNDAQGLIAITQAIATSTGADARWLSVTRYDERRDQELEQSFTTSTPYAYLVNGRLVIGRIGTMVDQGSLALFRVQRAATSTHLLWIKPTAGLLGSGNGIERLLGTMEFAE